MDVLQIDHTPVDVMVVDAERRLSIGRPWLTVAIDVASRMVAGFHNENASD
jgi:putative transposase